MSNTRKQQPEKISADCPHCGFSQLESPFAKSTICKKCNQGFSIEKLLAKEFSSLKPPSLFERLGKMVGRETEREIRCFSCGTTQVVSTAAESSQCKCGSYLNLRDFRISGPFGRTVQTQGKVTILPKGEVTTRILCGDARIEGKMRGHVICTGTVEMKLSGQVIGDIETNRLVVERRSEILCMRPLKVHEMEVSGEITAEVVCDGCVTVLNHGILKGKVFCRSVVVEKGGVLDGELHIDPRQTLTEPIPTPADEAAPPSEPPSGEATPLSTRRVLSGRKSRRVATG